MLISFPGKRLILHENIIPAFHSISDEKLLLLTGKIEKAHLVLPFFFVYLNDEIPAIFSNLEPGEQPKPAHAYYIFPL